MRNALLSEQQGGPLHAAHDTIALCRWRANVKETLQRLTVRRSVGHVIQTVHRMSATTPIHGLLKSTAVAILYICLKTPGVPVLLSCPDLGGHTFRQVSGLRPDWLYCRSPTIPQKVRKPNS